MLHNFPLKRRFISPTRNLAGLNRNASSNSIQSSVEPNLVSEKAFQFSATTPEKNRQDEPKPILQKSSITLNIQDRGKQLTERFAQLYSELNSADVSITCGRNHEILKAHRFVLSIGSAYFRDALKVAPCKHPIVVVKEIPGELMKRLLEYIYLGQVTLKSESELKQFFKSARYLQLFGVRDEHFSVED